MIKYILFLLTALFLLFVSCNKKEALNTKPSSAIVVPTSPEDMQGLLDNEDIFGWGTYLNYISADEFQFTHSPFVQLTPIELNVYIWAKDIFNEDDISADWNNSYTQVLYANIAEEGLKQLSRNAGNKKSLQAMRGDALFKRSLAFYHLLQLFAKPYEVTSAETDPGIPLRLTIDPHERIFRSSMQACYEKMLGDLHEATQLLPSNIDPVHRNRSCKPAAFALLARIYLNTGSWQQAVNASDSCLKSYDSLVHYDNIDTSAQYPFSITKAETLYSQSMPKSNSLVTGLSSFGVNIDKNLSSLYATADKRSWLFYRRRQQDSTITYKGSYSGSAYLFSGISTPEVYLIMAESHARLHHTATAMVYLNKLVEHRYQKGQFSPLIATDPTEALRLVLLERQKEMVLRGQRWSDVKRLSKQTPQITLTRIFNGQLYELPPHTLRYALQIPQTIVRKNGIEPNIR